MNLNQEKSMIESLKQEIFELQKYEAVQNTLNKQLFELEERIQQYNTEKQITDQRNEDQMKNLIYDLQNQEFEKSQLENELQQLSSILTQKKINFEEQNEIIDQKFDDINQLENQQQGIEQIYQETMSNYRKVILEQTYQQQNLDSKKSLLAQVQRNLREILSNEKEIQTCKNNIEIQILTVSNEIQFLEDEEHRAQTHLDKLNKTQNALNQESKKTSIFVDQLDSEIKEQTDKNEGLLEEKEVELRRLKQQIYKSQRLESDSNSLEYCHKQVSDTLQDFQSKNKSLRKQILNTEVESERLNEEIENYKQELQDQITRNKSKIHKVKVMQQTGQDIITFLQSEPKQSKIQSLNAKLNEIITIQFNYNVLKYVKYQ